MELLLRFIDWLRRELVLYQARKQLQALAAKTDPGQSATEVVLDSVVFERAALRLEEKGFGSVHVSQDAWVWRPHAPRLPSLPRPPRFRFPWQK